MSRRSKRYEEIDAYIQQHYCTMPLSDLADELGVDDLRWLVRRAYKLRQRTGKPDYIGKHRRVDPKWYTAADNELIFAGAGTEAGRVKIARKLGRSLDAIEVQHRKLCRAAGIPGRVQLAATPEQEAIVVRAYSDTTATYVDIAKQLGWTRNQVAGKVRLLRERGLITCRKKEPGPRPTRRNKKRQGGAVTPSGAGQPSISLPYISIIAQRS